MLWNAFFQEPVKSFNSTIGLRSVDWWIDLPFNSQLFGYLLKQSIFEPCTIIWQDFSAVPKCEGDMGEVLVCNFLCYFCLQRDAEQLAHQHTYNSEDIFMATGGFWESAHQVHGDKFHGHGPRSEIVLDVFSLFNFLLGTHLTVLAVHEYIFLHSFPVVQPLESCISSPEPIVTHVVMCKEEGCADQAMGEYYWFEILQIVQNLSPE